MADNIKSFVKTPRTIECKVVGLVETRLGDETFLILTLEPDHDGAVFLQSPELTAQGVAVHPYGAFIYNQNVAITNYDAEALFGGEVYTGALSLTSVTLRKFDPDPSV